jgi:radical SAM protein with 4Fe4S-binding SPASM domain
MDLRLAAAAVDWMVDRVRKIGRKSLDIHFFGGEPLFAPDVVDTVIHYARFCSMQSGLIPKFEVATNGVFDEDRCRFVGDYIDTVVLSFDGPEEIQNKYRSLKSGKEIYEIVARNAHHLSKAPSRLCIRTCVTQETVSYLDQVTEWFCRTFQPCVIDYETLKPTDESEAAGLSPPDPWEFAIMCIRALRIAEKYGVMPVYAAASIDTLRHSFCPVGRDTVIISPDGRINACYLLEQDWKNKDLELNLGYIDNSRAINLDQSSIERVRKISTGPDKCRRCLARWHCAGGCHVSNTYPGCPDGYDSFCIQTRIITVCRLLQELGCDQEVQRLIEDREALERLALNDSDRLSDWDG